MKFSESFLAEFGNEMANTRRTVERVPDEKLDWKPHQKSGTMRWLVSHLVNIPTWVEVTVEKDSMDMAPPNGEVPKTPQAASCQEALEMFDKNVAKALSVVSNASDEVLISPWSLLAGEKTIFTMPKMAVLRTFILNHSIHHRAQLGLYLRLNDVPVPPIYGPSADEINM